MAILKPKPLKAGDTIALIGVSGAVIEDGRLEKAVSALEELGYRVKTDENCAARYGYLAGTDEMRAAAFNRAFRDDSADAVFCARGGYGAARILDRLDYAAVRKNPKIVLGFSDVTALHLALYKETGLVTFHGPMPTAFWAKSEFTLRSLLRALTDPAPLGMLSNPDGFPVTRVQGGVCEGALAGGNLSLIASLMGTPWQLDARGKILLIEDIGEYTYRLDSMLTQLRNGGLFRHCAGVVLGGFTDCKIERENAGLSLSEIVRDVIAPAGMPIVKGYQIGHVTPMLTVPLGVRARLNAEKGTLEITESALSDR